MKLILEAIKSLFRKIEAQRTHWEERGEVVVLPETTITIDEDDGYQTLREECPPLVVGEKYIALLNGVRYECIARAWGEEDRVLIGNGTIYGDDNPGNNEPFSIDSYEDGPIYLNVAVAGEYMISILQETTIVHKLDEKYLPKSIIDGVQNAQNTADAAQKTANIKMNRNNPSCTGSFSMNRRSSSTVGNSSIAMGNAATASGSASTAMNFFTTASGDYSTAMGYETTASGSASTAIGFHTTSQRRAQHVQGEYNVIDATGNNGQSRGKYAHIVGNGTSSTARSNAHTLDWNGLGWFKGGLKIGGTSQDDTSAKEVATKDDKLPNPNALTFSGAVSGTYDGSTPLTIEIPQGGVSGLPFSNVKANLIVDLTIEKDADGNLPKHMEITQRDDGTPLNLKAFVIQSDVKSNVSYTRVTFNGNPWASGIDISHGRQQMANTFIVGKYGMYVDGDNRGFYPWDASLGNGRMPETEQVDLIQLPMSTQTITSGSFVKIWELVAEE